MTFTFPTVICKVKVLSTSAVRPPIFNTQQTLKFPYVKIPVEYEIHSIRQMIREVILAYSDTLGEIDQKLNLGDRHYQHDELSDQQKSGRLRLLAEQEVDFKLEEVFPSLESPAVTLQFAEKGGLTKEEIENVQQEYRDVLSLIGLEVKTENENKRTTFILEETRTKDSLIELIRAWYRIGIRDPNLLNADGFIIPDEWERKISLLKRRMQRLYQKISNPEREETRLDDYVTELNKWLRECFKDPRQRWQEPQVLVKGLEHEDGIPLIQFNSILISMWMT